MDTHFGQELPFDIGPGYGQPAAFLFAHLHGAMDAGSAGNLVIMQMLQTLPSQKVATFSSDDLIDYRANRPNVLLNEWVAEDVLVPETSINLLRDDMGRSFLVLHGHEPDQNWEKFSNSIIKIAKAHGVRLCVGMHGIPALTTHRMSPRLQYVSTNPKLLRSDRPMMEPARVPSSFVTFLQQRLTGIQVSSMTVFAPVPYYASEIAYPSAASALLQDMMRATGLMVPIGNLEQAAQREREQLDALAKMHPPITQAIQELENREREAAEQSLRAANSFTTEDDIAEFSVEFDEEFSEDNFLDKIIQEFQEDLHEELHDELQEIANSAETEPTESEENLENHAAQDAWADSVHSADSAGSADLAHPTDSDSILEELASVQNSDERESTQLEREVTVNQETLFSEEEFDQSINSDSGANAQQEISPKLGTDVEPEVKSTQMDESLPSGVPALHSPEHPFPRVDARKPKRNKSYPYMLGDAIEEFLKVQDAIPGASIVEDDFLGPYKSVSQEMSAHLDSYDLSLDDTNYWDSGEEDEDNSQYDDSSAI